MARMIGKGGVILEGGENSGGNNPQIQGGDHVRLALRRPPGNINEGSTKTDGGNIHTRKNESGDANINTGEKGNNKGNNNHAGDNIGGNNLGGNNPQIQGGNHGTITFGSGGNINEGSTKTDGGNIHTGKNESGDANINTGEKGKIVSIIKQDGNNEGGENSGGNNPQIQGGNYGTIVFGPESNINEGSAKTKGDNSHTEKKDSIRSYNLPGHNKGGKNKGGNNPQIQGGNHGTLAFRPGGNINEGSTKTDGGNIRTGKNKSGGGNINAEKK
ncbi:hypothetical protein CKAN_01292400 [Cinnamomum micranthum f. kanehirae]|uniref:Uncharacterized protein n=1 Tax=Cinnamomum micranthum f. kanehirae TaxID=337451 RepID=A0A3S3QEP8_9MAGN|nr:hypothetical protein CKAN_01292400 [Cinnamomum micranthum f. kanehirae]